MGVAAEAAGLRERGPSVLERRRQEAAAEEEAEASRRASRRHKAEAEPTNLIEAFEEAVEADGVRGRVRLHAISQTRGGLQVDDDRRKCLAEKGWARRTVVVHGVGPSGAANLEQLPGREDFAADESEEWLQATVKFVEDNFDGEGAEVRSMDQRDRKVGLFGDFCQRVGHGEFVRWEPNVEQGGYYELKTVSQASEHPLTRAARGAFDVKRRRAGDRVRQWPESRATVGAKLGRGA